MLEVYAGMILDLINHSAAQETTGPGWMSRTKTIDLDMKEWIDGNFNPEKFSLDKLDKELRQSS